MVSLKKYASFFLSLLFLLAPLCTQTEVGLQIEQSNPAIAEALQTSYFEPLVGVDPMDAIPSAQGGLDACESCLE
jgi:hypothetical protein